MGRHSRPEVPDFDFTHAGADLVPPYPQNYMRPDTSNADQQVATEIVQAVVPTVAPVIGPLVAGAIREGVHRLAGRAKQVIAALTAAVLATVSGAAFLVIQKLGDFADKTDTLNQRTSEISKTTRGLQSDVKRADQVAVDSLTELRRKLDEQIDNVENAVDTQVVRYEERTTSQKPHSALESDAPAVRREQAPSQKRATQTPTRAPSAPPQKTTEEQIADLYCQVDPKRC